MSENNKNNLLNEIYNKGNTNFPQNINNVEIVVPQGLNANMESQNNMNRSQNNMNISQNNMNRSQNNMNRSQNNMNRSIQVKNNKLVKNEIPKANSEFKKGTRVISTKKRQQGTILSKNTNSNRKYSIELNNNITFNKKIPKKITKLSKNEFRKI